MKPRRPFAWSYSALNDFETCPKRYAEVKVFKSVKEEPSEAALWGQRMHQLVADYLCGRGDLPEVLEVFRHTCDTIKKMDHRLFLVEHKMAFDRKMRLLDDFFHPNAWFRGVVDVAVVAENWRDVLIVDWKGGRPKEDFTQLKLFAKMLFSAFDSLDRALVGFFWAKTGKASKQAFRRGEIDQWWEEELLPRVRRMELAYNEGRFDPRPSGLCGKWCPVPKSRCLYGR